MMHFETNWLAIVLAMVASMALGMGWYMVFAKQWMAASGKTAESMKNAGNNPAPFIWAALMQLIMAYFLSALTPIVMHEMSVPNALILGAHLWFGFVLTSMILNHRFQGQKWMLTLIDGGYILAVMLVQAIVLGLFG